MSGHILYLAVAPNIGRLLPFPRDSHDLILTQVRLWEGFYSSRKATVYFFGILMSVNIQIVDV